MPSEKRARIKQNQRTLRQQKQTAIARRKRTRKLIIAAIVVILVFTAIYFITQPAKKAPPKKTTTHPVSASILAGCPNPNGSSPIRIRFKAYPPQCLNPKLHYVAVIKTDVGTFDITLNPKLGPKSANNFYVLSLYHYYNNTNFWRVIPGFVVQGGDPTNKGTGGPGYSFGDKLPPASSYHLGTVAMANTGQPNSDGSQFFIVVGPSGESLPPNYSVFGTVTSGMSVVNHIASDGSASGVPPKITHHIISISIITSK
ncbi:MAG: peptidylprolyl isomerase [Ferrimicrobium sp.]